MRVCKEAVAADLPHSRLSLRFFTRKVKEFSWPYDVKGLPAGERAGAEALIIHITQNSSASNEPSKI